MGIRRQGESGRLAALAAVAIALVAGSLILVNNFVSEAATDGAAMSISIEGETEKATVTGNETFTVLVTADEIPTGTGYVGFNAWVDFGGTGITLDKNPTMFWPDCENATFLPFQSGNAEAGGCLSGLQTPPPSFHKGDLISFDATCNADGTHTIQLRALGDVDATTSGAAYAPAGGGANIKVDNVDQGGGVLVADEMTVNCVGATDTPTPTDTPTVTPTPTEPDVPLGPRISLNATGENVDCPTVDEGTPTPTPFPKPVKCTAQFFPGQTKVGEFTVNVRANEPPGADYGGFRTEIEFESGLAYNARTACEDEVVWPDAAATNSCDRDINGGVDHTVTSASAAPFPLSDHVGSLLELDVHCTKAGEFVITLTEAAYLDEDGNDAEAVGEFDPPDVYILRVNCDPAPPEMSLTAFGPGVTCDPVEKPIKCTAPFVANDPDTTGINETEEASFTIAVDANAIPDGYMGFQTQLVFGGLGYHERSCLDEVIWRPDDPTLFVCEHKSEVTPTPVSNPENQRRHNVRTGEFGPWPANDDVGRLVEVEVFCAAANQFRVLLPVYTNSNQALSQPFEENPDGATFYNATDTLIFSLGANANTDITSVGHGPALGEDGLRFADTLRINCEAPPPTPTPTVSPTVTPTGQVPTATPCLVGDVPCTPTSTPEPTATNTPTNTSPPTNTPTQTHTPTPEPVQTTVPDGGGTVSTGLFASSGQPVVVTITTQFGGKVSILSKPIIQPDPAGFTLFGRQLNITAPVHVPAIPLIMEFKLDASIIPDGTSHTGVEVFRNGLRLPHCTGGAVPPGVVSACVAKRNTLVGDADNAGDVQIIVHTTTGSSWNFGTAGGAKPDLGDVNGDGAVNPADALLILQQTAGMADVPHPNVADVNGDGQINPTDAALILQHAAGLITLPAGSVSGWSGWSGLNAWY